MKFTTEQLGVLQDAINHFGAKAQKIKAIEELSELSVEFAKEFNGLPCNIIEELADVYIMLAQLRIIFDDGYGSFELALDQAIDFKLERLKKRIEEEIKE